MVVDNVEEEAQQQQMFEWLLEEIWKEIYDNPLYGLIITVSRNKAWW